VGRRSAAKKNSHAGHATALVYLEVDIFLEFQLHLASCAMKPIDFDGKTLVYASDLREDFRLLEVDEETLQDIIRSRYESKKLLY
jgi:hypothetical protein